MRSTFPVKTGFDRAYLLIEEKVRTNLYIYNSEVVEVLYWSRFISDSVPSRAAIYIAGV